VYVCLGWTISAAKAERGRVSARATAAEELPGTAVEVGGSAPPEKARSEKVAEVEREESGVQGGGGWARGG